MVGKLAAVLVVELIGQKEFLKVVKTVGQLVALTVCHLAVHLVDSLAK